MAKNHDYLKTHSAALYGSSLYDEVSTMTYSIVKLENGEVIIYLGALTYEEMTKQWRNIIEFFKATGVYDDLYILENETGKIVKLSALGMKKAELATKYGVTGKETEGNNG